MRPTVAIVLLGLTAVMTSPTTTFDPQFPHQPYGRWFMGSPAGAPASRRYFYVSPSPLDGAFYYPRPAGQGTGPFAPHPPAAPVVDSRSSSSSSSPLSLQLSDDAQLSDQEALQQLQAIKEIYERESAEQRFLLPSITFSGSTITIKTTSFLSLLSSLASLSFTVSTNTVLIPKVVVTTSTVG